MNPRKTSRRLYSSMLMVIAGFVLYILYANFIHDPQAGEFLSHKESPKRTVPVSAWLHVMHVHVIFACIAMVGGAMNFSNTVLQKYRRFHRANGYVYVASVMVVVLTSGYMAPYATGGKLTSVPFNLLNIIWPAITVIAILKIKKKQIHQHRQWMARSYAFCFTNLFIHLFAAVFHSGFGLAYKTSYVIGVYSAILSLFLLAEIVVRTVFREPPPQLGDVTAR
ncbi:DUF2306 domain-containing protein [Paenibacillus glucanolyticus]|uniref:DUF2306 domain-containing protein n=1 Tax=Paenibacillus glucanolyticus TaxID=59843 RepID=UPI00128B93CA|nr:DUF2306 domain-containing protein [Paenibacillus glucanolyticus]MPY15847.1 DUF2306 domain-containing protein [Paenibacillus glucanolyticus]